MNERFQDKVVWITGAGSGIGRALAIELGRQGASVAVSGRRVDRLEETVGAIDACAAAGGRSAFAVPCDVTSQEEVAAALASVVKRYGRVDVAVANAGYAVTVPVENLTAELLRRQLDVNVVGAVSTIRLALPELRKTGGRAVFVSSVGGMVVYPRGAAYCASKFALRAIGLALSQELAGTGVTCTTIYPGFVESEISQVDNQGVHHPERTERRPANLVWSADRAARAMAAGIHKRKREFVFTAHGRAGAWLGRHAPGLVHAVLARGEARRNRRKAKGTSDPPA